MNWRRQPRYFTNRLVNAYFPAFRAVLVSSGSFLFFFTAIVHDLKVDHSDFHSEHYVTEAVSTDYRDHGCAFI